MNDDNPLVLVEGLSADLSDFALRLETMMRELHCSFPVFSLGELAVVRVSSVIGWIVEDGTPLRGADGIKRPAGALAQQLLIAAHDRGLPHVFYGFNPYQVMSSIITRQRYTLIYDAMGGLIHDKRFVDEGFLGLGTPKPHYGRIEQFLIKHGFTNAFEHG